MRLIKHGAVSTLLLATACSPSGEQPQHNLDRADIVDACAPARVMLILDQSSSMRTGTINGDTIMTWGRMSPPQA